MEFSWLFRKEYQQQIKFFLKEKGVSKGLLAKIKFQGGRIEVNGIEVNVLYELSLGDKVTITTPNEKEHETLLIEDVPIDIMFEDEHFLIVNKPANVASIPSQYHPNGTMANRVKAYYKKQGYEDQIVHIVTRLDRDTTGLMLFAKHGFAHALMDQKLRKKEVTKIYQALVSGELSQLQKHGTIDYAIGRDDSSLLKRTIRKDGKNANTEYWLLERMSQIALVNIQLHTGRTHQIRVHFEALNCPLLGDEMYRGSMAYSMNRQALHCCELAFLHPFTKKMIHLTCPMPKDMKRVLLEACNQDK